MNRSDSTLIGHVESVQGSVVSIRLLDDVPVQIIINGESYRIGQIGAFLRIPIGFTQLYGVCTIVGAAAAPAAAMGNVQIGQRWVSITLFGESVGQVFERGVTQYPTIGDAVHLVTHHDLEIIYGSTTDGTTLSLGTIAASSGITAHIDMRTFVTRHSSIVGSTGSGKSNLISLLMSALSSRSYKSARILLIDPHGEHIAAVGEGGYVFSVFPDETKGHKPLYVPFWALPFDELRQLSLGELQPTPEASIRDEITERKSASAPHLDWPPPRSAITSDSPLPFSIKKLWYDLDDFERQTFSKYQGGDLCPIEIVGDPQALVSNKYPQTKPGGPFANPSPRRIMKQLDFLRSRLQDTQFHFLFAPGEAYSPTLDGRIQSDLDHLVRSWVGHDRPVTVLDV